MFYIKKSLIIQKTYFTLVEITMAIAIIGIGMAGVMALLPIGFNAARDGMGDNYSSDMADQFLHILAQQCLMYENGGTTDGWGDWITDATPKLPGTKPTIGDTAGNGGEAFTGSSAFGIYNDTSGTAGVFYVEAKSGSDLVDFTGVMGVWTENVVHDTLTLDKKNAVRLCIEVSWPPEKPYDKREKRYFAFELFNPVGR